MLNNIKKKKIMIVDDVRTNVRVLVDSLKKDFHLVIAMNGQEALMLLQEMVDDLPDLILLDVMMPDISGYEVCARLKTDQRFKHIAVIFLTALSDVSEEAKGLSLGAVDYITKPLRIPIVRARIAAQLELKSYRDNLEEILRIRTQEMIDMQLEVINKLVRAAEFRDNETGQHVKRLSSYCMLLGYTLGMQEEKAQRFYYASAMHDVGKIGIPDAILLKPGKLSEEEWEIMRKHTTIGAKILDDSNSELMKLASKVALSHHERWDGNGYPFRLKGKEIIQEGRILAVCDVFDALVSVRPYKKAWSHEEAYKEIVSQKGKQFDPEVVEAFEAVFNEIVNIKEELGD